MVPLRASAETHDHGANSFGANENASHESFGPDEHTQEDPYAQVHETPQEAFEAVIARVEQLLEAALEESERWPVVYVDGRAFEIDPKRFPDLRPLMRTQQFRIGLEGYLEQLAQSEQKRPLRGAAIKYLLGYIRSSEDALRYQADAHSFSPVYAARFQDFMARLQSGAANDNGSAHY